MTSGPCLRGCRVVRRYMPTNIGNHSSVVKDECNNYVSMYFEPLQPLGPVNTGVPPSGGTYVPQTQALPKIYDRENSDSNIFDRRSYWSCYCFRTNQSSRVRVRHPPAPFGLELERRFRFTGGVSGIS